MTSEWTFDEQWTDSGEMSGDPIPGEWVTVDITNYYQRDDLRAAYSVRVAHGPALNQPDQPVQYWVEDLTHTWRETSDGPIDDEYDYGEGSVFFFDTQATAEAEARRMLAHDKSIMALVYA